MVIMMSIIVNKRRAN